MIKVVKDMRKGRIKRGFTMAELLVVVAIIAVLGGVGAVAVQRYQVSLALRERNDIAKEMFIAAQNHLTMAETQGYPGVAQITEDDSDAFGTKDEEGSGIFYFMYNSDTYTADGSTVLDLMLPFGSIDETVRAGGRYLIRYRTNPATVLDVCYWTPAGTRFGGSPSYSDLSALFGDGIGKDIGNRVLVGHYGGSADDIEVGERLLNPSIEVENAERLLVKVKYPDSTDLPAMKLIITERDENGDDVAMASILMPTSSIDHNRAKYLTEGEYEVILDDITEPGGVLHFSNLNDLGNNNWFSRSGSFNPGNNITVKAVAYKNNALTNIAYSNEWTTNSLFADLEEDPDNSTAYRAKIDNLRHLENLDARVSSVDADELALSSAKQVADLVWYEESAASTSTAFTYRIATDKSKEGSTTIEPKDVVVYYKDGSTKPHCFLPVNLNYTLTYDALKPGDSNAEKPADKLARCHSITGIVVDTSAEEGAAGLFGAASEDLNVSNLALVNFKVTGLGNTGALVGELTDAASEITNVIAYNTKDFDDDQTEATIIAKDDRSDVDSAAGGLIGSMTGGTVAKCAAALVVKSEEDDAGGLIGKATEGSVTASFSGGHTTDCAYSATSYNVTAAKGNAGGLVGDAGDAKIENCYSTCSASGTTAGGLVGTASGDISECYATGLVKGTTTQGAFAGTLGGDEDDIENCLYYAAVNPSLFAVGSDTETTERTNITALDADTQSMLDFIESGNPVKLDWLANKVASTDVARTEDGKLVATCYDDDLKLFYPGAATDAQGKTIPIYILRTVAQLGGTVEDSASTDTPADFVAAHYGDWPAPETFVINTK